MRGCSIVAIVLSAGCAQAPGQPAAPPSDHVPSPARALQALADVPTWPWTVREDAPWATFPRAARLPSGPALHLDFHSGPGGTGHHQIRYRDGVAFTLRLVEGAELAVLDADAGDGEAVVALPRGVHRGWLDRLGKPGGTLTATDPIHFRREAIAMTGRADWIDLAARAVPFPWAELRGPDQLHFAPQGVQAFRTRWQAVETPDVPPLPPLVADFTVPRELVAGERGPVEAVLGAPLPAQAVLRWRTRDPDGLALPDLTGGAARHDWLAPPAPGTYMVDLTVETPWFRTTAPAAKPIVVRRELFLDTWAPRGVPRADSAVAQVRDDWPLTPGVSFALAAEGTMNPWGIAGGALCGAPEPVPMYPSPDRPVASVAVDPGWFFATLPNSAGKCPSVAVTPTNLLAFSLDDGKRFSAPRPLETTYQPSHRYNYPRVMGAGQPLRVRITDPRVWDNWGRIKLTIRR